MSCSNLKHVFVPVFLCHSLPHVLIPSVLESMCHHKYLYALSCCYFFKTQVQENDAKVQFTAVSHTVCLLVASSLILSLFTSHPSFPSPHPRDKLTPLEVYKQTKVIPLACHTHCAFLLPFPKPLNAAIIKVTTPAG